TPDDLAALEQMLLESGAGDKADIARAREESHGLGLFIRSLVGLDRQAATEAFSAYLVDSVYPRVQIDFVGLIVAHLTENGVMAAARLYESPFTDRAPHGPDSVFTDEQVDGLILVLDTVRAHAAPDATVA
ncbi:MAG: restriction endonuclease subunit R, partial [Actinomycetota bacterium]|nr:restriction endonuclease subunit R [Actinomycetota bacterium]